MCVVSAAHTEMHLIDWLSVLVKCGSIMTLWQSVSQLVFTASSEVNNPINVHGIFMCYSHYCVHHTAVCWWAWNMGILKVKQIFWLESFFFLFFQWTTLMLEKFKYEHRNEWHTAWLNTAIWSIQTGIRVNTTELTLNSKIYISSAELCLSCSIQNEIDYTHFPHNYNKCMEKLVRLSL